MPESPADDPMNSPALAFEADREVEAAESDATVAFLPPLVARALIAGWILLFSGRWIVVQGMSAAGLLDPDRVARLDDTVLGPCYLLLLSITLMTFALRIVRRARFGRGPLGTNTGFETPRRPVSAVEGTDKAEMSDQGGNQT